MESKIKIGFEKFKTLTCISSSILLHQDIYEKEEFKFFNYVDFSLALLLFYVNPKYTFNVYRQWNGDEENFWKNKLKSFFKFQNDLDFLDYYFRIRSISDDNPNAYSIIISSLIPQFLTAFGYSKPVKLFYINDDIETFLSNIEFTDDNSQIVYIQVSNDFDDDRMREYQIKHQLEEVWDGVIFQQSKMTYVTYVKQSDGNTKRDLKDEEGTKLNITIFHPISLMRKKGKEKEKNGYNDKGFQKKQDEMNFEIERSTAPPLPKRENPKFSSIRLLMRIYLYNLIENNNPNDFFLKLLHFLPLFYIDLRSNDIWNFNFTRLERDLYNDPKKEIEVALTFYILSVSSKIFRDETGQKRVSYLKGEIDEEDRMIPIEPKKILHFNLFEVYQYIIPLFDGFYEKYSSVIQ